MNLTVDIGNTRTKIALFDQTNLLEYHVLDHNEELIFKTGWTFIKGSFEHIIISSVRAHDHHIPNVIFDKAVYLNESLSLPITTNYDSLQSLGKDRLANVIAGNFLYPENNVLCLDMGTCIKLDLITKAKEYLGGSISPGLQMRCKALNDYTGKLPLIKPDSSSPLIGTSTFESINSGVVHAIKHELNGFIEQYSSEFNDLMIIGTGGDFNFFADGLKKRIFADNFLSLRGLNQILQFNL